MIVQGPKLYFALIGNHKSNVEKVSLCLSKHFETKIITSFDKIPQMQKSFGAIGYVMDSQSKLNNYNLEQLRQQSLHRPLYIFTQHTSIPLLHFALRLGIKDVFQTPFDENKVTRLVAEISTTTNIECFHQDLRLSDVMTLTEEILNHPLSDLFILLEKHFATGPSLRDIAKDLFLSPSRISHMFKDLCGIGYCQYILCRRLEESEYLLRQTDNGITNISYQLGFANPSHFCRSFKEHIGITPTAFMNNEVEIELSQLYQHYQSLRMDFFPTTMVEQVNEERRVNKERRRNVH